MFSVVFVSRSTINVTDVIYKQGLFYQVCSTLYQICVFRLPKLYPLFYTNENYVTSLTSPCQTRRHFRPEQHDGFRRSSVRCTLTLRSSEAVLVEERITRFKDRRSIETGLGTY